MLFHSIIDPRHPRLYIICIYDTAAFYSYNLIDEWNILLWPSFFKVSCLFPVSVSYDVLVYRGWIVFTTAAAQQQQQELVAPPVFSSESPLPPPLLYIVYIRLSSESPPHPYISYIYPRTIPKKAERKRRARKIGKQRKKPPAGGDTLNKVQYGLLGSESSLTNPPPQNQTSSKGSDEDGRRLGCPEGLGHCQGQRAVLPAARWRRQRQHLALQHHRAHDRAKV